MKLKNCVKLLVTALLLFTVLAVSAMPVFAASTVNENEQAVYDRIFNGTEIAGKIVCPVNGLQGVVYNYLIRDEVNMTAEQRDKILYYIDDCYALGKEANVIEWVKAGDIDLSHLTRAQKERLLANGKAAAAVMGMTFEYNTADNTVTIAEGDIIVCHTEAIVKQTDVSDSALPTAALVIVSALGVLFAVAVVLSLKAGKAKA